MNASALITGASSGIGAAYARELAARGYQLILVARRVERLNSLVEQLGRQYGIDAESLAADLSTTEGISKVEKRISELDNLEMLINNAGFGTNCSFSESNLEVETQMVTVHVTAPMRLCRAALPGMLERKKGALINVASVAAFYPLPNNATYAASKNYLVTFSEALQLELLHSGIRVQALCPGFTLTEFHDNPVVKEHFKRSSIPQWLWMKPEQVVKGSLKGLDKKKVVVAPGFVYWLMVIFANMIPHRLLEVVRKVS